MSSWPRVLQGLLLALVVFLAVVYLGSAASLPPGVTQSPDVEAQILPESSDASQPAKPMPTRQPGIQLVLGDIECEDGTVNVNFLVLRLPEQANDTAYGHVDYTVNGQAKTAVFVRRVGPVGRYVGRLDTGAGRYDVTAASITLDGVTAQLVNPHAQTVRCGPPHEGTPRPTEPRETPRTPRPSETARPTRTAEPTRTPRGPELRLDGIRCEDGHLQIHFVAGRLPEGTTPASLAGTKVDYTLQILTLGAAPSTVTGQAAFSRLESGVAHYVGVYPQSGAPQDGVYVVTEARLTLGAETLTLPFPAFPAIVRGCRVRPPAEPTGRPEPPRRPTVTPTATLKP